MITTSTFILLIVMCYFMMTLILGLKIRRQRKYYHLLYRAEKTKSFFAIARNEMMKMVLNNQVDSKKELFKKLYTVNTFIMRSPDEYSKISSMLREGFLDLHNNQNEATFTNLNEYEKKAAKLTADALGNIIIEYSLPLRFCYKLFKRSNKDISTIEFVFFFKKLLKQQQDKSLAKIEIENAKKEL